MMIVTEGFYGVLERWGGLSVGTGCLLEHCEAVKPTLLLNFLVLKDRTQKYEAAFVQKHFYLPGTNLRRSGHHLQRAVYPQDQLRHT